MILQMTCPDPHSIRALLSRLQLLCFALLVLAGKGKDTEEELNPESGASAMVGTLLNSGGITDCRVSQLTNIIKSC